MFQKIKTLGPARLGVLFDVMEFTSPYCLVRIIFEMYNTHMMLDDPQYYAFIEP